MARVTFSASNLSFALELGFKLLHECRSQNEQWENWQGNWIPFTSAFIEFFQSNLSHYTNELMFNQSLERTKKVKTNEAAKINKKTANGLAQKVLVPICD